MSGVFSQDSKKYRNITCEDLEVVIENKELRGTYQIIDVRSPGEYQEGHIPGSKLISVTDPGFKDKIEEFDSDFTYYVYCRSGTRSQKACSIMAGAGFEKVCNLEGGLLDWTGPLEE